MASSNIKLFDENKGNMLSDSEFSISNQRMNGLQTGVASSQLQNKAMYQASLVAYAIAQVMMQNGLNANDTDAVSAFVANLSGTMLQKVYDIATTAEAQAGTATGKWMSPALVKAFFNYMEANTSEAKAGTNNTKWMSPALVKAAIDTLAAKAQNILSNTTKAMYGLGTNAVPDDLFKTLGAELRVAIEPGTVVTASKDNVTLSATADSSGVAVFKILTFGIWTLRATIKGAAVAVPFMIDAFAIFYTSMSTNLEETSWAAISAIAEAGNAASVWSVGDTKTISFGGTPYTVQIIGFKHDTKTAGGKAGITFQFVNCLDTLYPMNDSNTTAGGWKSSLMRSRMTDFFAKLDNDLKSAIKPVNKSTSIGNRNSKIETVSDKLFLLSEIEVLGTNNRSFAGEGSQYAWYKAGNTTIKKVKDAASDWWGRSPSKDDATLFFRVLKNGTDSAYYATTNLGVSIAFCV